jgi:hypothetical protein
MQKKQEEEMEISGDKINLIGDQLASLERNLPKNSC